VPTYQYSCTECGHSLEAVQKFTDDALTVCPECDGRLRKVFNAVGVVFKGSGFYRTDSRSSGSASDGASTSPDSSTSTKAGTQAGTQPGTKAGKEPAAAAAGGSSSASD
jgi:putative FmdB family regulatory protein